jgi:hypothetical protein
VPLSASATVEAPATAGAGGVRGLRRRPQAWAHCTPATLLPRAGQLMPLSGMAEDLSGLTNWPAAWPNRCARCRRCWTVPYSGWGKSRNFPITGISHGGCSPHMSSIHAQTSSVHVRLEIALLASVEDHEVISKLQMRDKPSPRLATLYMLQRHAHMPTTHL